MDYHYFTSVTSNATCGDESCLVVCTEETNGSTCYG